MTDADLDRIAHVYLRYPLQHTPHWCAICGKRIPVPTNPMAPYCYLDGAFTCLDCGPYILSPLVVSAPLDEGHRHDPR